ncbi:hypothetical protein FOA52_013574 [Chlamydomonas sp. UWO 241]|nr:hypothetical protein FOA52_013574 [Chlamydomonas sp. UWO 241]
MADIMADAVAAVSRPPPPSPADREAVLGAVRAHSPRVPQAVADAAGALVVTPAEVRAAATHSKPGTAPGPDGIPVDVWRKLGEPAFELLAAVFTAVGATGGTPPGFLDGVVASIYKAKNAADAANYRPLTMLGSDYRILAKVLATRWTPLLSAMVGPEQTAFLAGRRISDNICLTQMLPGLLAANAAEGVGPTGAALALLDFRKAYDTIDRGFLIAVMEAVGVGDGVLAWTRTILTHTYTSAEVNGFISAPREYAAGVRQGCPAAPALFLFLGHALACFLRTCPAVGVEVVPGCRVTCPQYADDCMPLLRSCAPADVAALVETMSVFGRATGLVLNLGKCGILPLGSAGEGLLAGAEVAGLRVLDAGVSLGVPVSAGLPPPEGVTGALGPVARITGRVQTAELWGAEAPLWANPLLQLELPAAQRSVQWREPTGDAAGHALFSPTDAARWLVDGLARVRDALPGMRTVTDLCVLWAWLAAVDMVFAGLRGLEAAVPTLWRMPLLNARKEPIWRLWPPARSVAVERAGELATMDLWDALASFAEGGVMPPARQVPLAVVAALLTAHREGAKAEDKEGRLPLHYAVIESSAPLKVVEALLEAHPAGAAKQDNDGKLPLHLSMEPEFPSEGVIMALLAAYPEGAKVKADHGELPLHCAAWMAAPFAVVAALLELHPGGAKKDDDEGSLPLTWLLPGNRSREVLEPGIVKALLDAHPGGAKVKDGEGTLPLDRAVEREAPLKVVVALLEAYPEGVAALLPYQQVSGQCASDED